MRVAVVIPCYNVEAYVAEAITSALEQTYPVAVVIAVDNGSTDGTRTVFQKLQQRFPKRFQCLSEPRRGASVARNTGWRATSADWYQFLDADDILFPEKIERQIALAQGSGSQWVIGTPVYQHLDGTKRALVPWPDPWLGLAHGMYAGQTSANLYSQRILEQIGGWDEELPYTQDVDLAFRMLKNDCPYALDKQHSCLVRDRPVGKLSQMNPTGILEQHAFLRHEINQYLQQDRTEYWAEHQTFLHLALYRYLRMLACYEPALAAGLFQTYLPATIRLKPNALLRIPRWDATGVNLLGLERFATIKKALQANVPKQWWKTFKHLLSAKRR